MNVEGDYERHAWLAFGICFDGELSGRLFFWGMAVASDGVKWPERHMEHDGGLLVRCCIYP